MNNPIKVAVVEDSAVVRKLLEDLINSSDEVQVVGTANDGDSGLQMIHQTQPDVVCTDLQMPKMDGLALTKAVMNQAPCPILVLSSAVGTSDVDNVFELMQAGAADFCQKPSVETADDYEQIKQTLVSKIKILASKNERVGVSESSDVETPLSGSTSPLPQEPSKDHVPATEQPTHQLFYRGKPIASTKAAEATPSQDESSSEGQGTVSAPKLQYRGSGSNPFMRRR